MPITNISALGVGGLPVSESYRFRLDLKFADVGKTNSHSSICRALADLEKVVFLRLIGNFLKEND